MCERQKLKENLGAESKEEKSRPIAKIEKELKQLSNLGVLPKYKEFDDSSDKSLDLDYTMACTYFQQLVREKKLRASSDLF